MKHLFYYLLLALLLLSFPIKASDSYDEDSLKRGLAIYQTLCQTWHETREAITQEGFKPFFNILTHPSFLDALPDSERKARKNLALLYINAEKINIIDVIHTQATLNQEIYHRSSVFSAANILENKAFFNILGHAYPDAQSLILDVLRHHLKDPHASFTATYRFCDIINPALTSFLKQAILENSSPKTDPFLYILALDLLWCEPDQILPHALNAYLEDLFAKARSFAEIESTLPIHADKTNATPPQ